LDSQDQGYLTAAEGWLGLGNWREANAELENISAQNRAHPEVLRIRWAVYCEAKNWEGAYEIAQAISQIVPDDSFGLCGMAYALHQRGRTQEALAIEISATTKFPDNYLVQYNLALYACRLGKLHEAAIYLRRAFENHKKQKIPGKDLRLVALEDPELKPVWANIGEIEL
jgi:tetratricopeptide (TPR) repeat protein